MVAAAKFVRTDTAAAAKKSREICRILETKLAGDAAHGTCGIDQAPPRLQSQPLLNHSKGRAAGQTAAQSIQAGFGQRETPRVAFDRPMLEVLRFDQVAEAAQPFRAGTTAQFGSAVRGGSNCQNP